MSAELVREFLRYLAQDEPWRARAACRPKPEDTDEDVRQRTLLFFPHRGQTQKPAKALCARCPVQAECSSYADRSNSTYGIWGGKIRVRGPQQDKAA